MRQWLLLITAAISGTSAIKSEGDYLGSYIFINFVMLFNGRRQWAQYRGFDGLA